LIPGSFRKISSNKYERVSKFLAQCEKIGVAIGELFAPEDLIQKKNIVQVIYCLHSLAELCHRQRLAPFFTGPTRSVRKNKRKLWKQEGTDSFSFTPLNNDENDGLGYEDYASDIIGGFDGQNDSEELPKRINSNLSGSNILPQLIPVVAVTTTELIESSNRSPFQQTQQHFQPDEEENLVRPSRGLRSPHLISDTPERSFLRTENSPTHKILQSSLQPHNESPHDFFEPVGRSPQRTITKSPSPLPIRNPNFRSNRKEHGIPWNVYSNILKLLLFWTIMILLWSYSWKQNHFRFKFF